MRLYFIDRLDNAIFSRVNPKHEPASGGVICTYGVELFYLHLPNVQRQR